MKRQPDTRKLLQPPRPQPVAIPEDFPIVHYPPGKSTKHTLDRKWRDPKGRSADRSGLRTPKLVKISVRCDDCNTETAVMLTQRQLKRAKIKCSNCVKNIGIEWSAVRRG